MTNAQNLNCLALAKHLDKEKFEVYTLKLYSGNLKDPSIKGVQLFKCFYPHKVSKYLGYFWGIYKCDIAFLPKGEINAWNQFWLKLLNRKSFCTVEGILDEAAMKNAASHYGSEYKVIQHYKSFKNLYSITSFMRVFNFKKHNIESQIKILYLGTDIKTFLNTNKKSSELTNIILIGNDLIRKGVIEYFKLARSYPNIVFHIVGTGNGKIDVIKELNKLSLTNVNYHGGISHSELVDLLKKIDLHILPSRSEGFPKVTLETAAAGVPSMVYSYYGAKEWISDHHDGFVVDTLEEMKQTIQELVEKPDLLQKTSKNAIELAKSFDWDILIKDWENVIISIDQNN